MVEQTPGRRNQDVDATVKLLHLFVHRHAADQKRQLQLVIDAIFLKALRDLRGQLARRRQDQRARHTRPCASRLEPGDHRKNEGCGLAGARLGDAEHVAAGKDNRNGGGLYRGRVNIACGCHCRLYLG